MMKLGYSRKAPAKAAQGQLAKQVLTGYILRDQILEGGHKVSL
jgi:hypothetical protein